MRPTESAEEVIERSDIRSVSDSELHRDPLAFGSEQVVGTRRDVEYIPGCNAGRVAILILLPGAGIFTRVAPYCP